MEGAGGPEQGLLEHSAEALSAQSKGNPANIQWRHTINKIISKIHGTMKGEAIEEKAGIGCKRDGAGGGAHF